MKYLIFILVFISRVALADITVYFSPKGGATEAIVKEIDGSKKTILIQAYSFSSKPIIEALDNAHKRGVVIRIVLDKSQEDVPYSTVSQLVADKFEVKIDREHAIAHSKVMVIDSKTLITGSFNFTANAETSNLENLLVIHDDKDTVKKYMDNWQEHYKHSGDPKK